MIKIAVSGAAGKMGSRIITLIGQDKDLRLVVALEKKGHERIGDLIGEVKISDDPELIKDADCLVEFTTPQATIEHLDFVVRNKKPMVIGTTGLSDEQKRRIKDISREIPVVLAPNMSIGVNLLFKLVGEAAAKLAPDYTVDITEAHHIHKKDAPSGTAKRLAEIIKEVSGKDVLDIRSIREDEIVGDHKVVFEGAFDKLELSHSAKTRDIFARGAIEAAKFVVGESPGLYDMQDVIKSAYRESR